MTRRRLFREKKTSLSLYSRNLPGMVVSETIPTYLLNKNSWGKALTFLPYARAFRLSGVFGQENRLKPHAIHSAFPSRLSSTIAAAL